MTKPIEQMTVEELRNIQAHECGDPITVLGEAKNGEQELRAFDELARRNKLLAEALAKAEALLAEQDSMLFSVGPIKCRNGIEHKSV